MTPDAMLFFFSHLIKRAELTGDRIVNAADFAILKTMFFA